MCRGGAVLSARRGWMARSVQPARGALPPAKIHLARRFTAHATVRADAPASAWRAHVSLTAPPPHAAAPALHDRHRPGSVPQRRGAAAGRRMARQEGRHQRCVRPRDGRRRARAAARTRTRTRTAQAPVRCRSLLLASRCWHGQAARKRQTKARPSKKHTQGADFVALLGRPRLTPPLLSSQPIRMQTSRRASGACTPSWRCSR